ncbi:leucine-rich repeat-containing protein [Lasius niger]|uniref:Leucine-rich repeat-containing protein n=1 Tax=Lasius niger TaxID=67767 RepID=A0A0J7L1K6_LASNI|nr:leucine-rich repeat-containing protein [Lasius niger]
MHYQSYDDEEFEPRIIPKPITKLDCFAVPTVPEVSLIFEKPMVRNLNDGCNNSSPGRSMKPIRVLDNIDNTVERINSTSPILRSPNSYAAWREQNYTHEANSRNAMHVSPLCKNTRSCNHALQSDACIQKQQEQDKICDMQKREVNVRTNDGINEKCVKFICPDVGNSYNLNGETYLSPTNKKHLSCNSVQKAMFSISDHSTRMPNNGIPDTLKGIEHLQMPYAGYQQFHASNSNCNIDNNETVKTLLQLVNSQSEQIKNLQLQIDRLVRMQEESFRNRSTCSCSSSLANQVLKYPSINCYDTDLSSSLAQSQNKDVKKNENIQNTTSAIEKKDLKIFGDNNKLDTALLEQQSKKTFVEQKVSIGVMTSFEFTVQNSPFLLDSEIYEKKEVCKENNNINRRNAVNVHDTTEPVKRYKNTLTRKIGAAQLENIFEDSESYLSSNQQQSSNFNVNSSVRDSERQTLKESDICNAANTSESSKIYQYPPTDLNQKEMHKRVYMEENDNTNKQIQGTRKMFNASMNVECSPTGSMNCNKTHSNENDYIIINREKNTANMNANKYSTHNTHFPATDYYQNHRNKEYGTNTKQIKDVGDSMILSGGDLKILERPPPTPEPSIHVEMQEYTSDDESDTLKHTPKIGWTFYNNVLGQVNDILQNSSVMDDKNQNNAKIVRKVEQENDMETRTALNTVKAATLEQLRRLGISLTENNEYRESNSNNKTLDFDSSFYPRLDCQANMIHTTSVVNETNTSMHMKALALKYLSDEELADIALHKQESSSLKHLMVSNMQGTNMSLATMRYLERYKILPGKNNVQVENTDQPYGEVASKHDFKPATRKFPFVQTPGTTCPSRILDLSTLKRQPKLL